MRGIGRQLRDRARRLGLSDAEVARRAGLAERRYGNYVTERREPDLETLGRICRALGTTPDALLGFGAEGDEDTPAEAALRRLLATARLLSPDDLDLAVKQVELLAAHRRETGEG
jgi:transcriptional regulator with XRE-family HTH domain